MQPDQVTLLHLEAHEESTAARGAEGSLAGVGIAEAVAFAHECLVNGRYFEFISSLLDRDFEEVYDKDVHMSSFAYMKLSMAGAFITILPWCYGHALVNSECEAEYTYARRSVFQMWETADRWDCPAAEFVRSPWVLLVAPVMLVLWRATRQIFPARFQQLCRSKVFGPLRFHLWHLQYHKDLHTFDLVAFGFVMVTMSSVAICAIFRTSASLFCSCIVAWTYLAVANHALSPGDKAVQLIDGKLDSWPPAPGLWTRLRALHTTACWISVREAFAIESHISPCFGEPQPADQDTRDAAESIGEPVNVQPSTASTRRSSSSQQEGPEQVGVDVPQYSQNKVSRRDLKSRCYVRLVFLPELSKLIQVGSGQRVNDVSELARMRNTPGSKIETQRCTPGLCGSREILRCYNPHVTCRELLRYYQSVQRSSRKCVDSIRSLESTNVELRRVLNAPDPNPFASGLDADAQEGHGAWAQFGDGAWGPEASPREELGRSVVALRQAAAALIK